jgi:hypothetical protein
MKKILSIVLLAILISCGKDGSMGPLGPQGQQGLQGIRGEQGEDGSTIYSGAVVPQADLGNIGDFYFRTSTSDFYGPKTASGWGRSTNLRGAAGATGATGAAGSKILSGTAVPTVSVGANGDFYFRTTTADFYGPKTSSGWGTLINLRGAQGPPGTANVIYSNWINPTDATWNLLNTPRRKLMEIRNSQINLDIVNKGIVLVYYRTDNGWIVQLPYNIMLSNSATAVQISYQYQINSLIIEMRGLTRDILDSEYLYNSGAGFRYVIIPGGISATAMSSNRNTERSIEIKGVVYSKSVLEKMSYKEVSKLVGISE